MSIFFASELNAVGALSANPTILSSVGGDGVSRVMLLAGWKRAGNRNQMWWRPLGARAWLHLNGLAQGEPALTAEQLAAKLPTGDRSVPYTAAQVTEMAAGFERALREFLTGMPRSWDGLSQMLQGLLQAQATSPLELTPSVAQTLMGSDDLTPSRRGRVNSWLSSRHLPSLKQIADLVPVFEARGWPC